MNKFMACMPTSSTINFFEGLSDDEKAIVLEAATLAARIENTQKPAGAK